MYYVSKRMEIAGAHNLTLNYESKCQNLHGHNWIVTVYCKSKNLNENGMVEDFTNIKKMIHDKLDHQYINNVPELKEINPTAENIAKWICEQFGKGFRPIVEVQKAFLSRPMPDEALCAILWEYKDRGQKGYDMTERMFELLRAKFPDLKILGPERAGRDILLGEVFENYPKPDRPADFIIKDQDNILAVGFARYDSDRGGAQEDDRTGGYSNAAREILDYAIGKDLRTKIIFVNDGPGLLLGSMWDDYCYIEEVSDDIKVVTLRMIPERITLEWLHS